MKVYHVKYTIALLWNFGISTALILEDNVKYGFLVSKKATIWWLRESQSNNKLLQKTMTSSY